MPEPSEPGPVKTVNAPKAGAPAEETRAVSAAEPVQPAGPAEKADSKDALKPATVGEAGDASKASSPVPSVEEVPATKVVEPIETVKGAATVAAAEAASTKEPAPSDAHPEVGSVSADEAPHEPAAPPEPERAAKEPELVPAAESDAIVCSKCGVQLAAGLRFCTACGTPVIEQPEAVEVTADASADEAPAADETSAMSEDSDPPSVITEVPGEVPAAVATDEPETVPEEPELVPAEVTPAAGACAKCGAQLSPGVRFCIGCGAPVATLAEAVAASPEAIAAEAPEAEEIIVTEDGLVAPSVTSEESREETAESTPAGPDTTAGESEQVAAVAASDPDACPNCGTPSSAGVRFCIGCGAPVEFGGAAAAAPASSSSPSSPPPNASPAPITRKGVSAGALVAIFLVLLVIVAGCAFWLVRSMRFSPLTDIAITEIPSDSEDSAAEPPGSAGADSGLTAEDAGQPSGIAPGEFDIPPAQDDPGAAPSDSSGTVSSPATVRSTPTSSGTTKSSASTSPTARKAASPPPATKKAAQTAQNTAPAPPTPIPFVDDPPPSGTAQTAAPASTAPASPPPAAAATPEPVQPAAPTEGIIYWTGKLQRNKRFIISTKGTDYGFADGKLLPGTPVEIRVLSPAVRVVEAPGPVNSWQRIILECTRNTNQSVTVNVQWFAAR